MIKSGEFDAMVVIVPRKMSTLSDVGREERRKTDDYDVEEIPSYPDSI